MYVKSSILTAASGLVGWRYSTDSNYTSIGERSSSSGYYVNDLPGISVGLLTYARNEFGVCDYIDAVHESETLKVMDAFIAKQKRDLTTKELLSHNTLVQDFNDLDDAISRNSRFMGYVITPRESNTIVSKIKSVGFISSAAQSFTLYLYDTSHKSAIQSETITITQADTIEWTTLDWDVSFDREAGSAGQSYLLGYFEDDLSADLYEQDWTTESAHVASRIFGHYMGVYPLRIVSTELNGTYIPNRDQIPSMGTCKTPGFNLRFNTKCDISKVLVDNIDMFAQAVQYAIAVRILGDVLKSNIDLNAVSNARDKREDYKELIQEYNTKLYGGYMQNIGGADLYIRGIIDQLSFDFSYLDPVCLKKKSGEIVYAKWE